jgi:hypothetical protein
MWRVERLLLLGLWLLALGNAGGADGQERDEARDNSMHGDPFLKGGIFL